MLNGLTEATHSHQLAQPIHNAYFHIGREIPAVLVFLFFAFSGKTSRSGDFQFEMPPLCCARSMNDSIKRNDIKHDAISDKFVEQSFAKKSNQLNILHLSFFRHHRLAWRFKADYVHQKWFFSPLLACQCTLFSNTFQPFRSVSFEFNYNAS